VEFVELAVDDIGKHRQGLCRQVKSEKQWVSRFDKKYKTDQIFQFRIADTGSSRCDV
jgi:hypothetical protein